MTSSRRFRDDTHLFHVPKDLIVRCPRCDSRARFQLAPGYGCCCCGRVHREQDAPRLVCASCGLAAHSGQTWGPTYWSFGRCGTCGNRASSRVAHGDLDYIRDGQIKTDCARCGNATLFDVQQYWELDQRNGTYGGVDLWLKIPCEGHLLWALDREHLDLIESYVAATLRERTPNVNRSFASRLPRWIQDRRNRDTVLRACERLRATL